MLTTITNYFKYIIVAVVSFLLGYSCYAIFHSPTTNSTVDVPTEANRGPVEIHEISRVTLKEKQKESDPDLVVDNRYIAEIHGQTFEIPKTTGAVSKDSKGLQTKVTSDINMTPVVRKWLIWNTKGTGKYLLVLVDPMMVTSMYLLASKGTTTTIEPLRCLWGYLKTTLRTFRWFISGNSNCVYMRSDGVL